MTIHDVKAISTQAATARGDGGKRPAPKSNSAQQADPDPGGEKGDAGGGKGGGARKLSKRAQALAREALAREQVRARLRIPAKRG